MTAPVTQVAGGDAYTVVFVLPAKCSLDTVLQPRNPRVEIRAVPAQLVASWRYSGRWTESNHRESEERLREQMAKRDIEASGEPILAQYDPPFMSSFLRRNCSGKMQRPYAHAAPSNLLRPKGAGAGPTFLHALV